MRAVLAVADLLAAARLESAARAAGYEPEIRSTVPDPAESPPDLLVADLDAPGALERLERWRAAHPDAPAAGFAFHVNEDVLARAKALGVRTVSHGSAATAIFGNPPGARSV